MNRILMLALTLAVAAIAAAQQPADPAQTVVAVINGETIARAKLDTLYNRLSPQMRAQYEQSGGKRAFLDNYVAKRLLVQEAMKANIEQQPQVKAALEAARESVLFDQYVREVIGSEIVTEADIKKYYTDRPRDFVTPEQIKARHIVVLFQGRTKEQALDKIKQAMTEIRAVGPASPEVPIGRFAQAAEKYSEDGTKTQGGDLGWFAAGTMDAKFEDVAFRLKPGTMSGIVETQFGYHLILLEAKREAGTQSFEEVRTAIRETLLNEKMAAVMTAVQRVTGELRRASKVSIYQENLD
jgi:peptidyl-prolyl cis-trans isomerase C